MHFSLAIIHKYDADINEILAPYNEEITVAPYRIYTREEAIKAAFQHWGKLAETKTEED